MYSDWKLWQYLELASMALGSSLAGMRQQQLQLDELFVSASALLAVAPALLASFFVAALLAAQSELLAATAAWHPAVV